MKQKLLNLFVAWLGISYSPTPPMTKEQEIAMFGQLYENPTFLRYLDARERYLVDQGMEDFLNGAKSGAERMAGQLLEVRNLRRRARDAFTILSRQREQRKLQQ